MLLCVPVCLCPFRYSSSSQHRYLINSLCVRVCGSVFVSFLLLLFISARHGYLDFADTFVYVHVYDCVVMPFLLLLVIGSGRPFFRNFGHVFVYVCAHACVSMCARVCVCLQSLVIRILLSY